MARLLTRIDEIRARLSAAERQELIVRVGVSSAEGGIRVHLSEADNSTSGASYQEGFGFAD